MATFGVSVSTVRELFKPDNQMMREQILESVTRDISKVKEEMVEAVARDISKAKDEVTESIQQTLDTVIPNDNESVDYNLINSRIEQLEGIVGDSAALTGLVKDVTELIARLNVIESIARSGSRTRIFNTFYDLRDWLAVESNRNTCKEGDMFHLRMEGVPDFWYTGDESDMYVHEGVFVMYVNKFETQRCDS